MSILFETRESLKSTLKNHTTLADEVKVDKSIIQEVIENLKHGEMSIAVVGEVNRGKSTFLNALMGTKLFPSRASVCTAGVTVLDYGDEPKAEIIFNNGKTKSFELPLENPAKTLVDIVSRKNENVQDIKLVRIYFPNQFTGNGLVLVDTPGVNDPDTWREDITYEYLSNADAIIMLLDPMQPLSESETEFLEHKILGKSIANLIFVVNKIDDVSSSDRVVALGRIENVLKKYVPNPTIFPVSSKPALKAKQTNDEQALNISGFPEFESGLLEFLAKGRGGLLLKSKIQKGVDHLSNVIQTSIDSRLGALDSEKGAVRNNLRKATNSLIGKKNDKNALKKELESKVDSIKRKLTDINNEKERYLNNSLKPALMEEPSISILRNNILSFQKDCIEGLQDSVESIFNNLLQKYGSKSSSIMTEVNDILSHLSSEASSSAQSLKINKQKVKIDDSTYTKNKRAGAVVGGVIGAGAGATIAATATTTAIGVTSIGTIGIGTVAAFSTAATIGIGIMTGGLGLLLGAGIASLLSAKGNSQRNNQSSYVEYEELVNNKRAILAVERFVSKLKNNISRISEMMVNSLINELVKPIDQQITSQNNLINQINTDLNQTVEGQQSTRDFLASKTGGVKTLNSQYQDLIKSVESL